MAAVEKVELRPVPGYPNYLVTRDGRIWTVRRPRVRGGWMRLSIHKGGYPFTMVRVDGRSVPLYAHVAVALAWIGPKPDGMEVCHGDGNPQNNTVENLRWDTRAANIEDAFRHGRRGRATGKPRMSGLQDGARAQG